MTNDIALKDFVLTLEDKLKDIQAFIETDTYIDNSVVDFDHLCHIGWLIYEAGDQLDIYIKKNIKKVTPLGSTQGVI